MLIRYMSLILLLAPRGKSEYICAAPTSCRPIQDCISEQSLERSQVLFPCGRNKVCCSTRVKIKPTSQNLGSTTEVKKDVNELNSSTKVVEKPAQAFSKHPNFPIFPASCGPTVVYDKIVDGDDPDPREFPWMALLGYKTSRGKIKYACGGSMISDRYILTAAHCLKVENVPVSQVRLGDYNRKTDPDCFGDFCFTSSVNIAVEKKIAHKNYDTTTHRNDIALLRLASAPTIISPARIAPICVPWNISNQNIGEHYEYEASGWGTTGYMEFSLNDILQKVKLRGVSLKDCNAKACPSTSCPIIETQICAQGDRKKDVCKGDSGGPLMSTHGKSVFLIGITSIKTTEECGASQIPSIFTKVESYLSWILDNVEP